MNKILLNDYASLKESKMIPKAGTTCKLYQADIIINPVYGILLNKTIIINLPMEVPIDSLIKNNTIISRFPIGYGIEVIPYVMPENQHEVTEDDMSCLILNKYLLTDNHYLELIKNNKFILGISEVIDGEATLIGMEILSNKIENII